MMKEFKIRITTLIIIQFQLLVAAIVCFVCYRNSSYSDNFLKIMLIVMSAIWLIIFFAMLPILIFGGKDRHGKCKSISKLVDASMIARGAQCNEKTIKKIADDVVRWISSSNLEE